MEAEEPSPDTTQAEEPLPDTTQSFAAAVGQAKNSDDDDGKVYGGMEVNRKVEEMRDEWLAGSRPEEGYVQV